MIIYSLNARVCKGLVHFYTIPNYLQRLVSLATQDTSDKSKADLSDMLETPRDGSANQIRKKHAEIKESLRISVSFNVDLSLNTDFGNDLINIMNVESKDRWWELADLGDVAEELQELHRISKQVSVLMNERYVNKEFQLENCKKIEKNLTYFLRGIANERIIGKSIPYRIECLEQIFKMLGDLYLSKAKLTQNPEEYTDSAKLYQYAIHINKEKLKKEEMHNDYYYKQLDIIYVNLIEIFASISQGSQIFDSSRDQSNSDKQILIQLREESRAKLQQLDQYMEVGKNDSLEENDKLFIKGSRSLFENITKSMKELLAKFFKEAEDALGSSPCAYEVVGLGSMALGQITPYSDLEFAILIEGEGYIKDLTDPRVQYFKNLSHLVHLRVINLGETPIEQKKFGLNLDHLIKKGVSFDLGGKTSLGRKDKPYCLIQTVNGMLYYLKNEYGKQEHRDKNLPYILETVLPIYSNMPKLDLIERYTSKVAQVFSIKTNAGIMVRQALSLKRLTEDSVEYDYCGNNNGIASLQGNMKAYSPQLIGYGKEGNKFNVKKNIYRLVDRYLYDLAFYYGVDYLGIWQSLGALQDNKIINQQAEHNLLYASSFATVLRLKTYLHHDSQNDDMGVLALEHFSEKQLSKVFHLSKENLKPGSALFRYYYTAFSLQQILENFVEAEYSQRNQLLYDTVFYDENLINNAKVFVKLLQYDAALNCLKQLVYNEKHLGIEYFDILFNALLKADKYNEALKLAEEALERIKVLQIHRDNSDVLKWLNNIAAAYLKNHKPQIALTYLEKAEKIMEESKAQFSFNADILNNLGHTHFQIMHYQVAFKYYDKALNFLQRSKASEDNIVNTIEYIGGIHLVLGQYEKAFDAYVTVFKIRHKLHNGEFHLDLSHSFFNLGNYYSDTGNHNSANYYFFKALEINNIVHQTQYNIASARCLDRISRSYTQLGKYKDAARFSTSALEIVTKLYSLIDNIEITIIIDSLGDVRFAEGDYEESLNVYTQSYEIRQRLFPKENHAFIAISLYNMGKSNSLLGNTQTAHDFFCGAYYISKVFFGFSHPIVADALEGLGNAMDNLGKSKEALETLEKCLEMRKEIYSSNKMHFKIADVLHNIGNVHLSLKQSENAVLYFQEAMKIIDGLNMNTETKSIALLNNIANTYLEMGNCIQAKLMVNKALIIAKERLTDSNLENASSYHIMGDILKKDKKYQESLDSYYNSLKIRIQICGESSRDICALYNNIGLVYLLILDFSKAFTYLHLAFRSAFPFEEIKGVILQSILKYTEEFSLHYSLNLSIVAKIVQQCINQDLDFGNSKIIDELAKAFYEKDINDYAQECYKIAAIFASSSQEGHFVTYDRQSQNKNAIALSLAEDKKNVNFCNWAIHIENAQENYNNEIIDSCIESYRLAIVFAEDKVDDNIKQYIYHNLACAYYISDQIQKANLSFQKALKYLEASSNVSVHSEYANFLIAQKQYKDAYYYLKLAIESRDVNPELCYGAIEKKTVPQLLRKQIENSSKQNINIKAIYYAYYLFLTNWEIFKENLDDQDNQNYLEMFAMYLQQGGDENYVHYALLADLYQIFGNQQKYNELTLTVDHLKRKSLDISTTQENIEKEVIQDISLLRLEIDYSNTLLSNKEGTNLLVTACVVYGSNFVNLLLNLGQNRDTASAILSAVNTEGAEKVLLILGTGIIGVESFRTEQVQIESRNDNNLQQQNLALTKAYQDQSNVHNYAWINSMLKQWVYRTEISSIKGMLKRHEVDMTWQEAISKDGYKEVALKLHPDKNFNNKEVATKDFQYFKEFKDKYNAVNTEQIVQQCKSEIYKVSIGINIVDTGLNVIKIYNNPTLQGLQLLSKATNYHGVDCANLLLELSVDQDNLGEILAAAYEVGDDKVLYTLMGIDAYEQESYIKKSDGSYSKMQIYIDKASGDVLQCKWLSEKEGANNNHILRLKSKEDTSVDGIKAKVELLINNILEWCDINQQTDWEVSWLTYLFEVQDNIELLESGNLFIPFPYKKDPDFNPDDFGGEDHGDHGNNDENKNDNFGLPGSNNNNNTNTEDDIKM